nr:MAG TPA: hypothetical protein [Caudoviricetes sp.]
MHISFLLFIFATENEYGTLLKHFCIVFECKDIHLCLTSQTFMYISLVVYDYLSMV